MPGDEPAPTSSVQPVTSKECHLERVHQRLDQLTTLARQADGRAQKADDRAKSVLDGQLELHQLQVKLVAQVGKFVDPVGLVPRATLILVGAFLGGAVAQALFCAGGMAAKMALAVLP